MKLKELYLSLIKEGKKDNVSELDIRYLLSYYFKINDSSSFFLSLEKEVNDTKEINSAFMRLKGGEPVSYIINETDFLGEKYYVDKNVLIPRVETEELVTLAIRYLEKIKDKNLRVLDIGTGSGVIAINIKKRFPNFVVDAIDISKSAIDVAKKNALMHKVDINFYLGDTFPNNKNKYDVIISNPPYILDKKEVDKSVLDYEPHNALFINENNNVYKNVLSNLDKINIPCFMIFEIDPGLENKLSNLINKKLANYSLSYIFSKDINKKTRFLSILLDK